MAELKSNPPIDFTALPKIELHAHLTGSISPQCLHEVWLKKETDLHDPLTEMGPGKIFDLKTFFPLFSSYTYHLVNDAWSVTYTTLSVLRDFAADGVVYLELRTTPRAMPEAGMTKEDYVRTVLDAIAQFEAETASSPGPGMHTRLILSIDRGSTLPTALEVVALASLFPAHTPESFGGGIVALDLCGDPATTATLPSLAPAFAAARSSLPQLGLTLHFAEAECSGTEAELAMLLSWDPDRLGHVIWVGEEARESIVSAGRRGRKLGLELCLSCNVIAGMVEGGYAEHHFGGWLKVDEVVVMLCTDDVGVFGSPLSNEYALAAEYFGLGRSEICTLARKGIDVIFGGEEEKARLREIMWVG
ncbi:adenosine deaminase [Lasiosphaeris hirsuta]|uniref:Adenosine deaminase n=1 Tax=Lasiosphaeris hirsuta TaxID=260670 RepID=A0AA40A8M3_9PEZI|nr:adenosine deaminase [Lasiosphaeris hirsuta]